LEKFSKLELRLIQEWVIILIKLNLNRIKEKPEKNVV
jgi:hypothetical protein